MSQQLGPLVSHTRDRGAHFVALSVFGEKLARGIGVGGI